MLYKEFAASPNFNHNLYVCYGEEKYFHNQIRILFKNKFPEHKTEEADADADGEDFYSKVESNDLFSEQKIIFVDNSSKGLGDKKFFEQYVKDSSGAKYVVFGDYKSEQVEFRIDCSKIKDSLKEVIPYIQLILREYPKLGISSRALPIFHYLYRNDLQLIDKEIEKINLYNKSLKKDFLEISDIENILSPSEVQDIFKFSNNFMHRKLKGALNALPEDEFLPHLANIFSLAEKIYFIKKSKMGDDEAAKNYQFNNYYYLQSIKPLIELWSESELQVLLVEMNEVRLKLKEFKYPVKQFLKNSILRYCHR